MSSTSNVVSRQGGGDPADGAAKRATETSRLARRTAINLLGSGVSASVGVGLVVLVTRGFGKNVAGSLFVATSVFVVLQATGRGGVDAALQYFMPRVSGRPAQRRLLRMGIMPTLLVSALAGLILFGAASGPGHAWSHGWHSSTSQYLAALAPLVPVAVACDLLLAGSRALGRSRPTVLLEQIGRPLAQLVLTATVVAVDAPQWLALAWAAPYALALLPAVRAARPKAAEQLPAAPDPGPTSRELWRFSAPRALASLSQIAIQRLDIVLIAVLRGVRDAALYTAATRFLVLGQLINQAIALPLQPRLGVFMARSDLEAADSLYGTSTGWTVALAWPLYLTFAVWASESLQIFGHGYTDAAPVVLLLSIAMLVATGCGPVDLMLIMAGRTTWNLANTAASLTVFLCADLLLIPPFGATGAAIGWSLAIITNNVLPLWQVRRHLGCWPITRVVVSLAAAALVCFALIPLTTQSLIGRGWLAFGCSCLLGTSAYCVALWRLRARLGVNGLGLGRHTRGPHGL